jgi:hypothetical protein
MPNNIKTEHTRPKTRKSTISKNKKVNLYMPDGDILTVKTSVIKDVCSLMIITNGGIV